MNFGHMALLTRWGCENETPGSRFHLWLAPLTKDLVLVAAIDSLHAVPWCQTKYFPKFFPWCSEMYVLP